MYCVDDRSVLCINKLTIDGVFVKIKSIFGFYTEEYKKQNIDIVKAQDISLPISETVYNKDNIKYNSLSKDILIKNKLPPTLSINKNTVKSNSNNIVYIGDRSPDISAVNTFSTTSTYSSQNNFSGYLPSNNYNLIGISNIGYLNNAIIDNSQINKATINNGVIDDATFFNSKLVERIGSVIASSSLTIADNPIFTNATITNAFISNFNSNTAIIQNLNTINATSTNFFSNILRSITG
ncbi:MAG: hypothetical protein QM532_03000, partial [Cyanobium sp. MAG06]|nr:hypothetical protein [Cyanobium sp. MAG06]